jgi:hypothetical protein
MINLVIIEYIKIFKINKILEFAWEDHHSPPIDMLFDVCKKVD